MWIIRNILNLKYKQIHRKTMTRHSVHLSNADTVMFVREQTWKTTCCDELWSCSKTLNWLIRRDWLYESTLWFKKNAPTLEDFNNDPVQPILIIFSKLFGNDHKSCLVVKFSTSPHICCHYTLWNTILYFSLITLLIAKKCANFGSPYNFNKR